MAVAVDKVTFIGDWACMFNGQTYEVESDTQISIGPKDEVTVVDIEDTKFFYMNDTNNYKFVSFRFISKDLDGNESWEIWTY